jgi:hypothetical protein
MTATMHQRRARFVAKLMAFLWLFGFAVAVANACVVNHVHAAPASAHPACVEAAPAVEGDPPVACQPACKGLCESDQNAVAKNHGADVVSAAPLVALPGASCVHAAAGAAQPWRAIAQPPPPGSSVAIRFLRLTI